MVEPLLVAVFAAIAAGAALLLLAVQRRNVSAVVNAGAGLALTAFVTILSMAPGPVVGQDLGLGLALPLWLAVASALHAVGMLGWYESVSWWDHLTHTVSAALVAALLYAGVLVADPTVLGVDTLPGSTVVLTVALAFAVGVAWELLELVGRELGRRLDVEPVLIYYGPRDTALDLAFDVLGALLVVALDYRIFVTPAEQFPDHTETLLLATAWLVGLGSIAMASFLVLSAIASAD